MRLKNKYDIQFTGQFKRDFKLAKKQYRNLDRLFKVIDVLAAGGTLDEKYRDHALTGNYKGTRECHVEPDACSSMKFAKTCWSCFFTG